MQQYSPINLAELQVFSNGQQWPNTLLSANASSIYSSDTLPANVIDGDLTTFYNSGDNDAAPTLTVTAIVSTVDSIIVYNRQDCCQDRMNGATITVTAGPWQLLNTTFEGVSSYYAFEVTSSPTSIAAISTDADVTVLRPGFSFKVCKDYFKDDPNFFKTCNLKGPTGVTSDIGNIMTGTSNQFPGLDSEEYYSVLWTGFFIPDATGVWNFYTNSDDASYVWLGKSKNEYLSPGQTIYESVLIRNGFIHGANLKSAVAYLVAGQSYEITIAYGQNEDGQIMNFQFQGPSGSSSSAVWTSTGSGLFFHCPLGNDCVPLSPANVAGIALSPGLAYDVCYDASTSDTDYFSSCPLEAYGVTESTKSIQDGIAYSLPDIYLEYSMSIEWRGFFKPDVSGPWTFILTARPSAYLWLGPLAVSGSSFENAFISSDYTNGGWDLPSTNSTVYLEGGQYYDLKIIFNNPGGYYDHFHYGFYGFVESYSSNMSFAFYGPEGSAANVNSENYDGQGFYFVKNSTVYEQRRPFVESVDVSGMNLASGLTFDTCDANLMNLIFEIDKGNHPGFACRKDHITIRSLPMATGLTNNIADITSGVANQITRDDFNSPSYTVEWRGYFRADATGLWKFTIHSSHNSFLWLGNSSLGFNQSLYDAVVHNIRVQYFDDQIGKPYQRSGVVYLQAGEYYPLFMIFAKQTYYVAAVLNFKGPPGSLANTDSFSDGRGFFFSHYPIEPDVDVNSKDLTVGLQFKIHPNYCLPTFPENSSPFDQIFEINPFLANLTKASTLYSGVTDNLGSLSLLTTGYPYGSLHSFSVEWTGYFLPDVAGVWKFTITSDADFACLWVGPAAVHGLNFYNGIVRHEGNITNEHIYVTRVGSVLLLAGQYYPLRIAYSTRRGANAKVNIVFEGPIGSLTFNKPTSKGQGFLFSRNNASSVLSYQINQGYFDGNANFFDSKIVPQNNILVSTSSSKSSPTKRPTNSPSTAMPSGPAFPVPPGLAFLKGVSISDDNGVTINFFSGVSQIWSGSYFLLGNFISFSNSSNMLQFGGGDTNYCDGGISRYGAVFLSCGETLAISRSVQPSSCAYYFNVTVPNLCTQSGVVSSLYNVQSAMGGSTFLSNAYSILWTGLFLPDVSGIYTFQITSNNASALWLGPSAASGWTNGNALIVNNRGAVQQSITLVAGQSYPIRIVYGTESSSGQVFQFTFQGPPGSAAHSNSLSPTTFSSLTNGFFKLPSSVVR